MSYLGPYFAMSLLLGGVFVDNPGVQASARWGNWGVVAGVGHLGYTTAFVGPEYSVEVGRSRLQVSALYGIDRVAESNTSLLTHLAVVRVGAQTQLSGAWFLSAELSIVRFPVASSLGGGGGDRSVPVDVLDGDFFVPGVGIGYAFGP